MRLRELQRIVKALNVLDDLGLPTGDQCAVEEAVQDIADTIQEVLIKKNSKWQLDYDLRQCIWYAVEVIK